MPVHKLPRIDPAKLPYSRNAILGLPDSGKTVTAKKMAEQMMQAGTPITVFDPAGTWRFLRVPGKGRGYHVVVIGGMDPDLPMNDPRQAADIMRAVMQSGISVVFDLYDPRWSKEDWKRIVEAAINILWYENKPHGLRHVFLEEAAEFIPQTFNSSDPHAGKLYATIEKIARMGRNAYLGMTLINQRAEGVNKAVLELCTNLMLHKQKGRNSLQNLSKWLDYIDSDVSKEIIGSLPTLPTGECWAWTEDHDKPEHIKIPMLDSYHPNIAEAQGEIESAKAKRKPVKVDDFVEKLRVALPKIEEEAKQNDPTALRAELKKVRAELAAAQKAAPAHTPADPRAIQDAEARGYNDGVAAMRAFVEAPLQDIRGHSDEIGNLLRDLAKPLPPKKFLLAPKAAPVPIAKVTKPLPVREAVPKDVGNLSGPHVRILNSLATWKAMGFDAVSNAQCAWLAGYSPRGGAYANPRGALKASGLIEYPGSDRIKITPAGGELAEPVDINGSIFDFVAAQLSNPERRIFESVKNAGGGPVTNADAAAGAGYEPNGGAYANPRGALKSKGLIVYPASGMLELAEWLK